MLFSLYRIVVFVLYALAFPLLGTLAVLGSVKWRNRLGRGFADISRIFKSSAEGGTKLIWAHAASAGEVRALAYFVRTYSLRNTETRFIVTVVTDSGYETAYEALGDLEDSGVLVVRYLPFDCPQSIHKALNKVRPDIFVFTETEIWPNWTAALVRRGIPYVLLNARLTERSLNGYLYARSFVKRTMSSYELVICQGAEHVERFQALGVAKKRICVSGNIKNDAPMRRISDERRKELRERLGAGATDYLMVCGSIRHGEFAGALEVYQRLASKHPRLRFVLAPRHLERCEDIQTEAQRLGIQTQRFSAEPSSEAHGVGSVIIVDVFGVLREMYGAADLTFVGGTMVPIGGHNILEPPQVGAPVLFGPHTTNVTEGVELVLQRKCGLQVSDWLDFARQVERGLKGELTFGQWDADLSESSAGEQSGPLHFSVNKIEDALTQIVSIKT